MDDVRNGVTIQKLSQLFEKLKEKYEAEGKTLPTYNTYRQTMRKKLNISANKTNIQSDLIFVIVIISVNNINFSHNTLII